MQDIPTGVPTALPPGSGDRVMVVVAHPDDETIGAGSRLGRFADALVVHLTDGAPRTGHDARAAGCATWMDYAALRRRELETAVALAGLSADRLVGFGYPDQAASENMAEAACGIERLVAGWRPDVVLAHPYEGGHPDHDAAAFAVHAALALCRRRAGWTPRPVEMAFYQDGDADGVTVFQAFLPDAEGARMPVATVHLDGDERVLKRRMLDAHASQAGTLASFRDDIERYRPAPVYDFLRPPHAGRLNYERFDWGMTGRRWRGLATRALHDLDLGSAVGREAAGWH